tara:strand:- start:75 stop:329 length:255 start_codon:yes stop_codon:yes gene_type:complete
MAIREDNKKVQDNMNYQTDKFKMQGRDKEEPVRKADLSNKLNTKQINDYIDKYRKGEDVSEIIKDLTFDELESLKKLADKRISS